MTKPSHIFLGVALGIGLWLRFLAVPQYQSYTHLKDTLATTVTQIETAKITLETAHHPDRLQARFTGLLKDTGQSVIGFSPLPTGGYHSQISAPTLAKAEEVIVALDRFELAIQDFSWSQPDGTITLSFFSPEISQ